MSGNKKQWMDAAQALVRAFRKSEASSSADWYQRAVLLREAGKAILRSFDGGCSSHRELQEWERGAPYAKWLLDVADDMEAHAMTPRGIPRGYKKGALISIKDALPPQRQACWVEIGPRGGWETQWIAGFDFWQPFIGVSFGKSDIAYWMPDGV